MVSGGYLKRIRHRNLQSFSDPCPFQYWSSASIDIKVEIDSGITSDPLYAESDTRKCNKSTLLHSGEHAPNTQ